MTQLPLADAQAPQADQSRSERSLSSPRPVVHDRPPARTWIPEAVAVVVCLLFAYAPNLLYLITIWDNEPNYSHGFLVGPIALVILWRRLSDSPLDWSTVRVPSWSWAVLAVLLLGRALIYERGMQWLESASIIPVTACLVLILGGWPLLVRAWPAVAFLVFMLPLPPSINTMVSLPLQRVATAGSCFALQLTGLWVVPSGNVITLNTPGGSQQLEVAMACNGLSMLMTLAATVTATVILIPMPAWKRIVVLLSALPIALLSNIVRIVATGWCYYYMDGARARAVAHDWSGYLMMPLALVLVGLELWILSWLFNDAEAQEADRPISPLVTQRAPS